MKQTVTTTRTWCDDCKRENKDEMLSFNGFDICYTCIYERVRHSRNIVPLGRQCKNCRGTGKVKEFYGYNNDHNWVFCSTCNGRKYINLEELI